MWYLVIAVIGPLLGMYIGHKLGERAVAEELALKASAAKEVDKVRNIFESR